MLQHLGDYKVIKQIGQGSLGDALLAEHRFIKKLFVLKILPKELAGNSEFLQAFEEEVGVLAALDHPHIAKVHNVSFADGYYFIVSDCVTDACGETTNLAQYMAERKERLKEEELIHLLRQLAEALDYAHSVQRPAGQKGIVHGTFKLNNILIGKGKPGIEVFISDLGLAKIIGPLQMIYRCYQAMNESLGIAHLESDKHEERFFASPLDVPKISKLNFSFLQNFAFLAPEQKKYEGIRHLDPKMDVYAFGVLAYFLIAGKFPEGFFEMPSEIAPEYKRNWDELIKSCLHIRAEKRPNALVPVLEDLLKERPLQPLFMPQKLIMPTPEPLPVAQLAQVLENKIQYVEQVKKEEFVTVASVAQPKQQNEDSSIIASVMTFKDSNVSHYQPEEKDKRLLEPIPSDMVIINGGYFQRGSKEGNRDEMPRHQVFLSTFAMDVHPVTNEQFMRFIDFIGGEKDGNYHDLIRLKDSRIKRSAGKLLIESGYNKHPVVGVTWYGAIGYANWVRKRLPTEAEWEIAAYGGNENAIYPTGNAIEKTQANFFSSDTAPAMSFAPNNYGLYDMAGNVYEWCNDWYGYNYYEASAQEPNKPKGPLQGVYRVLRGGCWKSLKDDLRCAHRHRNNPGAFNGTYGFRCVMDL